MQPRLIQNARFLKNHFKSLKISLDFLPDLSPQKVFPFQTQKKPFRGLKNAISYGKYRSESSTNLLLPCYWIKIQFLGLLA